MKKCKKIKELKKELFKNRSNLSSNKGIGNFGFSNAEMESSLRLTFEKVN